MALPPSDGARASTRLKQLIQRKGQVLSVMHPPTAALARIMERTGCEALFVGTSAVVGGYTGLADVGTASPCGFHMSKLNFARKLTSYRRRIRCQAARDEAPQMSAVEEVERYSVSTVERVLVVLRALHASST